MNVGGIHQLTDRVAAVAADCADRDTLTAALRDTRTAIAWWQAQQGRLTRQLEHVSAYPERDLAAATGVGVAAAGKVVARNHTAATVPALGDAFTNGAVTAGHLDAVSDALRELEPAQQQRLIDDGPRLAALAQTLPVDHFRRQLRHDIRRLHNDHGMNRYQQQQRNTRLRRWIDQATGMGHLAGCFDPYTYAAICQQLDHTTTVLFHNPANIPDTCPSDPYAKHDHLQALALTHLITGHTPHNHNGDNPNDNDGDGNGPGGGNDGGPTGSGGPTGGTGRQRRVGRPEVIIVIDTRVPTDDDPIVDAGIAVDIPLRVLADLIANGQADQHEITIRNGIVIDAPGTLDLERSTRYASADQRRVLRALYPTCAIPACPITFDHCTIHHIIWWRHNGLTNLDNLLPLCHRHHHNIHDNHWQLTLTPNRTLTINYPNGHTETTHPPPRGSPRT